MSVEALTVVLHHSAARGTAKLVLLGIANHDGDGGAWPAVDTLAVYAGVDPRNVQVALRQLEASGELVTHRQDGGTGRRPWYTRPNRYELTVACPVTCDRSSRHRCTVDGCGEPASACGHATADRVMHPSPGDAGDTRGGDASITRGVMPATPEPSLEPPSEPLAAVGLSATSTARVASPVDCGRSSCGCDAGWLGDPDQPIPCPACKPSAARRTRVRRGLAC